MRNTISEIKNTGKGINSRFSEAEDQISDLEHKVTENTESEKLKEKGIFKNDERLLG